MTLCLVGRPEKSGLLGASKVSRALILTQERVNDPQPRPPWLRRMRAHALEAEVSPRRGVRLRRLHRSAFPASVAPSSSA